MIPLQPVVIGKTESRRSAKVTPFFVNAESKSFCRTRSSGIFHPEFLQKSNRSAHTRLFPKQNATVHNPFSLR